MRQATEAKALCDDALTTERGIAVKLDTKDAIPKLAVSRRLFEELHLLGARDAERDGVDSLV